MHMLPLTLPHELVRAMSSSIHLHKQHGRSSNGGCAGEYLISAIATELLAVALGSYDNPAQPSPAQLSDME